MHARPCVRCGHTDVHQTVIVRVAGKAGYERRVRCLHRDQVDRVCDCDAVPEVEPPPRRMEPTALVSALLVVVGLLVAAIEVFRVWW
jgi:hypothetical protein